MFTGMAGCAARAVVSVGAGQLTSSREDGSAVTASPSSLVRSCSTRGLGRRRTWPVRRCCVRGRRAAAWADTATRAAAPAGLPPAARPSFQPRALREPGSRRRREERSDHPVPCHGQLVCPAPEPPPPVHGRRTAFAAGFGGRGGRPEGGGLRREYGCATAPRRGTFEPSAEARMIGSAPAAASNFSTVRVARPRPHRARSPHPADVPVPAICFAAARSPGASDRSVWTSSTMAVGSGSRHAGDRAPVMPPGRMHPESAARTRPSTHRSLNSQHSNSLMVLTIPDAAQSVPVGPLCLLSGLAAHQHVRLTERVIQSQHKKSHFRRTFDLHQNRIGAHGTT